MLQIYVIRTWACRRTFVSVMLHAFSFVYVHEKGLRCVFRSPQNRGFTLFYASTVAFVLFVVDRAVGARQPNKDFTDYFQNSQCVSPKWFHL